RHEITAYTAIASAGDPPVPLPRMLFADPALPLIVLTMMPGSPLGPDRYPVSPLPPAHLDWLLDAAGLLHGWHHPALRAISADTDYDAQFQALPADLFSPGEPGALAAEADRLTRRIGTQLEHGDAHPGNAMVLPGAPLALIDLELLAHRLPGYDLAVLWTITGPDPALRSRIIDRIGPGQRQAAFWLNAILVTGREILSHRRNAPTPMHHTRLARLLTDLQHARAHIRQILM
ncbi:MAG: aminoglycoside phosphotransferase family protein, partial [Nocardiopsaceae bacterium]|nr:aminoglycoside phosphotransferase family protein [Nocardiopsaceae bacterium]